MSILQIEDNLILDEGSDVLKRQYDNYCSWCWGHGYGNCDKCKKIFNHYYVPIRIKELQAKNGICCEKQIPSYRFNCPKTYEIENWIIKHKRKKKESML